MTKISSLANSFIRQANGPTIILASGTYFDYCAPENSTITIDDIAFSLAFEGRFAGQCVIDGAHVFYSVAEHCVRMSWAVPAKHAYDALMHESGEAVCGDVTGPLKSLCPEFKAIEKRCEAAIHTRFAVPMRDRDLIKLFDLRMLATERRDLLSWSGERWTHDDKKIEPLSNRIDPWSANEAAFAFLSRFEEVAPPEVRL